MIREKDFIRIFILDLILVKKGKTIQIFDKETILLPNNYMKFFDEIIEDDVKRVYYRNIIPIDDNENWKYNITKELNDFLKTTGIRYSYHHDGIDITVNSEVFRKILNNPRIDSTSKNKIMEFTEEFVNIQNKKVINKLLILK